MAEALRWIIGTFILLNAIWGAVPAVRVARLKRAAGRIPWPRPVDPVLESLSWPLVLLWLAALVLFVASAVLLVLATPATVVAFLAAFLLDAAVFWRAQRRAAGAAFGARERLTRSVLFGLLAVASLGGRAHPTSYAPAPPDGVQENGGCVGPLRPVA